METTEIIKLCIGSGGLLGIGFIIFKIGRFSENFNNFKNDVNKKFDKIDEKFEIIRDDIHEVKERITYLEASNTFFNIVPTENARSEAAKRSWKAKKAKQLAKLERK